MNKKRKRLYFVHVVKHFVSFLAVQYTGENGFSKDGHVVNELASNPQIILSSIHVKKSEFILKV